LHIFRREFLKLPGMLALPVVAMAGVQEGRVFTCQYRARATVLMLSAPLLHRDNVGSGYLHVSRQETGGRRQLRLEFGAGSLPERAAGMNRLGVFEETIVEAGELIESASYFGFMTASNEKDLDQARTALHSGPASSFTAIRGQIERGQVSNRLLRIQNMASMSWAERERLTAQIRAKIADQTNPEAQSSTAALQDAPCSPFLYAVNRAMRSNAGTCSNRFIHNGQMHLLKSARKPGGQTGEMELDGKIYSAAGKELSTFRLWFDPAKVEQGPLKFEFRPRSFLRLTFERV